MAKSCRRMSAFSASDKVSKMIFPVASRLSDQRWGSTMNEATAIPLSEPMGLKACAKFSRRVEDSLSPNDKMNGLAVVSKKAKPKVKMYKEKQKKENS